MEPQVFLHQTFTSSIMKMPANIQKQAWDIVNHFPERLDSNGLNYEKLKNSVDSKVYSVRVNQGYRAIVVRPKKENVHLFVYVDRHDEAYSWAERKRFEVNPHVGTLQVWTSPQQVATSKGIFGNLTKEELLSIGVPEEMISVIQGIPTLDDLDQYQDDLHDDVLIALQYLGEGTSFTEVSQMFQLPQKEKAYSELSFAEAAKRSPGEIHVVTSDSPLEEILQHPFDRWRLFLHPSQQELVEKDFTGPARVLGGAGTGKTVVALHRARRLLRKYPEDQLLFTTYNTNLAGLIGEQLDTMCTEEERKRIQVIPIDRLAREIVEKRMGITIHKMMKEEDQQVVWQQIQSRLKKTDEERSFARAEWELVIQPKGIESLEEYLTTSRAGRGKRVSKTEKEQAWHMISVVREEMRNRGWYEFADLIRMARVWVERYPDQLSYRSLLIDEAQDLSEEGFRLLRALVPRTENDLFLVGDPYQRIYQHKVTLSQCGIEIRGQRSKRLRINYRTTKQIRKQAVEVIAALSVDDLDGGQNQMDDISLIVGMEPQYEVFRTADQEKEYICQQIKALIDQGYAPEEIAIFGRTQKEVSKHMKHLEYKGFSLMQITGDSHLGKKGSLFCGTMHRSKGLEFRAVFLVGINHANLPHQYSLSLRPDPEKKQEFLWEERSLFYVASTRARERLYLSGYGKPSEFLLFNKE